MIFTCLRKDKAGGREREAGGWQFGRAAFTRVGFVLSEDKRKEKICGGAKATPLH